MAEPVRVYVSAHIPKPDSKQLAKGFVIAVNCLNADTFCTQDMKIVKDWQDFKNLDTVVRKQFPVQMKDARNIPSKKTGSALSLLKLKKSDHAKTVKKLEYYLNQLLLKELLSESEAFQDFLQLKQVEFEESPKDAPKLFFSGNQLLDEVETNAVRKLQLAIISMQEELDRAKTSLQAAKTEKEIESRTEDVKHLEQRLEQLQQGLKDLQSEAYTPETSPIPSPMPSPRAGGNDNEENGEEANDDGEKEEKKETTSEEAGNDQEKKPTEEEKKDEEKKNEVKKEAEEKAEEKKEETKEEKKEAPKEEKKEEPKEEKKEATSNNEDEGGESSLTLPTSDSAPNTPGGTRKKKKIIVKRIVKKKKTDGSTTPLESSGKSLDPDSLADLLQYEKSLSWDNPNAEESPLIDVSEDESGGQSGPPTPKGGNPGGSLNFHPSVSPAVSPRSSVEEMHIRRTARLSAMLRSNRELLRSVYVRPGSAQNAGEKGMTGSQLSKIAVDV